MTIPPVEVTAVLSKSREDAFTAFVTNVAKWWPLDKHSVSPSLGEGTPETLVIEQHECGRIYEVSTSGVERFWGTITKWAKDQEIAFSWHPGKDPSLATSVSVTFTTIDNGKTAVTLTHSGWEILGDDAATIRDHYNSGWTGIIQDKFTHFAEGSVSA